MSDNGFDDAYSPIVPKRKRVTRSGREKWEPTGDHHVGYGRPPENKWFGPNNPGSRAGRKLGSKNIATAIDEAFRSKVRVKEGGKVRKLSNTELLAQQIVKQAVHQGNLKAISIALNHFGKQANTSEQPAERRHTRDDHIVLEELQEQLRAMKGGDDDVVS